MKKIGIITSVDGSISTIGVYELNNDSKYILDGKIVPGTKVGSFLTIYQNDIKIIATIVSEQEIDNVNNLNKAEFDNRFQKNSIKRVIKLKTKGIIEDGKFYVTSKYVPMIGNEVSITSHEELDIIYYVSDKEPSIFIGNSIIDDKEIKLPINSVFASHIGIFGNTGSGKSNTLHKLYMSLFKIKNHENKIFNLEDISRFFIIDFNGEYVNDNSFGITKDQLKTVFRLGVKSKKKLAIIEDFFFDADILSILFSASPGTQIPFLKKSILKYNKIRKNGEDNVISYFVIGLIKRILTTGSKASPDARANWCELVNKYLDENSEKLTKNLEKLSFNFTKNSYSYFQSGKTFYINAAEELNEDHLDYLKFEEIKEKLLEKYNKDHSKIDQLDFFLNFQKIYASVWGYNNIEHLNPLFNRIGTVLKSIQNVIKLVTEQEFENTYKMLNIISLVDLNQESKQVVPLLLSKMIYNLQKKNKCKEKTLTKTTHLVIDEAHNILNSSVKSKKDDMQEYRLSIFEEIIKEGRKFGFFLTLSSQRPYDISETILSQIHNYFIHRLVNEGDIASLEKTMPTLDKNSYDMIPNLGQGEVIVTGRFMPVSIFVKIEKEEIRPNSDDILLTNIWFKENGNCN